jgi:hypothetical protein
MHSYNMIRITTINQISGTKSRTAYQATVRRLLSQEDIASVSWAETPSKTVQLDHLNRYGTRTTQQHFVHALKHSLLGGHGS